MKRSDWGLSGSAPPEDPLGSGKLQAHSQGPEQSEVRVRLDSAARRGKHGRVFTLPHGVDSALALARAEARGPGLWTSRVQELVAFGYSLYGVRAPAADMRRVHGPAPRLARFQQNSSPGRRHRRGMADLPERSWKQWVFLKTPVTLKVRSHAR